MVGRTRGANRFTRRVGTRLDRSCAQLFLSVSTIWIGADREVAARTCARLCSGCTVDTREIERYLDDRGVVVLVADLSESRDGAARFPRLVHAPRHEVLARVVISCVESSVDWRSFALRASGAAHAATYFPARRYIATASAFACIWTQDGSSGS